MPKITPSVINEYLTMESNPRWFFAFMGDLAVTEPSAFAWMTEMAVKDIVESAGSDVPAAAAIKLNSALRRMFIRGLYFGKKHELSNWIPEITETPITDKNGNISMGKMSGDLTLWGETSEISDEDFV